MSFCLLVGRDYKPGDYPAPEGYLAWHAWAEVQHKAGLKQTKCGKCGSWQFPQELSDKILTFPARNRYGEHVKINYRICKKCDEAK